MLNLAVRPIDLVVINWEDKQQVIKLAQKMGGGLSVIKYSNRRNYNITHTVNEATRKHHNPSMIVVFRT